MNDGEHKERSGDQASQAEQYPSQNTPHDPLPTASDSLGSPEAVSADYGKQQPDTQGAGPPHKPTELELATYRLERRHLRVQEILAFVAVIALVVGGFQLWTMSVQNSVMLSQNRIMLAQQRPWIGVNPIPSKPTADQRLAIEFEFRNSGQSAAELVEVVFQVIYFTPNEPIPGIGTLVASDEVADGKWRDEGDGTFVRLPIGSHKYDLKLDDGFSLLSKGGKVATSLLLSPSMTGHVVASKGEPLDEKTASAIREGAVMPVIISTTIYADGSGGRHYTNFTGIYNRTRNAFDVIPSRSGRN